MGAAPVGSYAAVRGLYDMLGNVWEWTLDRFESANHSRRLRGRFAFEAPSHRASDNRVEKGGSFLCHRSYCHRYRIAARTFSSADSTSGHLGFRCAFEHGSE